MPSWRLACEQRFLLSLLFVKVALLPIVEVSKLIFFGAKPTPGCSGELASHVWKLFMIQSKLFAPNSVGYRYFEPRFLHIKAY